MGNGYRDLTILLPDGRSLHRGYSSEALPLLADLRLVVASFLGVAPARIQFWQHGRVMTRAR